MTKKELLHIISQGENVQVEFKENFSKQVIETIVAFANTKGGSIFIGVADSKQIKGIEVNDESLQNWNNQIKLSTEPSVFPDIKLFEIENKIIAFVEVDEFPVKPISVKGKYYKRVKNSNHLLTINEINDIYLKSMQLSWDSYPYQNSTFTELDEIKILKFIERVNSSGRFYLKGNPKECLEKLHLVKNNIPTNAAMILFAKDELFYNIHIGRFKTQSHIIDDKMVRGTLFEAVENTMKFIVSHLKVAFEITGKTTQRTEIFEYPLTALRELVLNAVIHRDYTSPTDIQIKIFDKEITIFNPGKLYGNITIEDLKTDNYQAQSRNKLITEAFYLTKDIEKYGSGYRRVRKQIAEYPTMYFNFEENSGGFLVKVGYEKQKTAKNVPVNVPVNVLVNVPVNVPVNVRQKEIIAIIQNNNNVTIMQLANRCKVNEKTIRRDLKKLTELKLLKRIGSDKTGHWKIIN